MCNKCIKRCAKEQHFMVSLKSLVQYSVKQLLMSSKLSPDAQEDLNEMQNILIKEREISSSW